MDIVEALAPLYYWLVRGLAPVFKLRRGKSHIHYNTKYSVALNYDMKFIERGPMSCMPWQDIGTYGYGATFYTPILYSWAQFKTTISQSTRSHGLDRERERERESETQKTRPEKAEDGFLSPDGRTDGPR